MAARPHDPLLANLDSVALVDAAVADRRLVKRIGQLLAAKQPDEQAARNLVAAYRDGRCPPWLTAYLLGCVGHAAGYETARDILLSRAGLLSESYAGVAMAKMRGVEAYDDLRQILFDDQRLKVREGAMYGMSAAPRQQLLEDLLIAFNERRLLRKNVAVQIAECNPPDEWLLQRVHSESVEHQRLVCAVIAVMVSPNSTLRTPENEVAQAMKSLLNDNAIPMSPHSRERLLAWLAG